MCTLRRQTPLGPRSDRRIEVKEQQTEANENARNDYHQRTALGPRYAVILKEKDADRYLPILVGASDANAIAIKLHNPQVSLNLTHDLLCTVIDALGGSVRQVLINRDCPDQTDSSNHVTLWDGSNYKRAA